ncbi:MAG: fumarate reductase subunit D [Lysobacterales bacterium CG17_big_fil_post_rev_8_21_14_2_50_64_11]|nr:MAG: fumarate reductase subunit D [Xanthomonadales bacterium CG17_big_fil_post_rev_8_21_14_2_50_64_11]PIX60738.1 MAG: fumarate reductase subunit D [Xanthomonadales bacterium CG_4_10_14_3_um_filter_64_11]
MSLSNKPIVWLPFAAGGMLAALLVPALMLVLLLDALQLLPPGSLDYPRVVAFVSHPLARVVCVGVIALLLWHAAHRLRMTVQDIGVRSHGARQVAARLCYGAATLASVALIWAVVVL